MGHYKNPIYFGGVEISNYELYQELSRRGNKITILSSRYPGSGSYEVNENFGYIFAGFSFGKIASALAFSLSSLATAARLSRDYDVLIEDQTFWSPSFSFLLKRKIPVILRIHDFTDLTVFLKKNGLLIGPCLYANMKIYPKLFKNWIVVSKVLNDRHGIDGKVIGNGIDQNIFEALPKQGNYIAYMGRLDIVKKGLDIMIEALRILNEEEWFKQNRINVQMAGDGQDKQRLLTMISKSGLCPHIELVGWVEGREKVQFMEDAEFLLMPSRFEGQPIVSLEAGACYKPLIVSDIPELSHVTEHGYGASFQNFSPADLAEKIRLMHEDPGRRMEMGFKGRKFAESNKWSHIAERYEAYLRGVIEHFHRHP